jgi:hypothetical protein
MKKTSYALLSLVGIFSLNLIKAQTAEEIINKNIEAMGGKEKLRTIKTVQIMSALNVMGNEAISTRYMVNGMGILIENEINGQKEMGCVTDTGSWFIDPNQSAPQPLPQEEAKSWYFLRHIYPLLDYAARGNKAEIAGRDSVNGINAFKIKFTTPDTLVYFLYFDPVTYYVLKEQSNLNMGGENENISFSSYQKTDFGVLWPMKDQITSPRGLNLTFTHKQVDFNKEIDPKIFIVPKF